MGRTLGPGDEPFAPAHDVAVAPALGPGQHHAGGVGARARRRLGHDDGGADPAVDDRLQPALLLLGRADLLQHQHVAVVGCSAVAGHRPEARAAQLLVDHRHADRPQALAAALPRHLRRPQATRPRLLAQPGQEILADVLALAERGRVLLEREKDLRHEGGRALTQLLELGGECQIQGVTSATG